MLKGANAAGRLSHYNMLAADELYAAVQGLAGWVAAGNFQTLDAALVEAQEQNHEQTPVARLAGKSVLLVDGPPGATDPVADQPSEVAPLVEARPPEPPQREAGDCPLGPNHEHHWTGDQCDYCMQLGDEIALQKMEAKVAEARSATPSHREPQ